MALLGALLAIVGGPAADTVRIRPAAVSPRAGVVTDTARWGEPQVRLPTGQGTTAIWLLRSADSVFIIAVIPDSTPYWGDELAISLDTGGQGAPTPQHEDFQWQVRRALDSSVVYRGRNGRWEPPRDDPDWRLGGARSGGGWGVGSTDGPAGWAVALRLDPAWFAGDRGRLPRIAFRVFDDRPQGSYAWPIAPAGDRPATVERTPALWVPVQ